MTLGPKKKEKRPIFTSNCLKLILLKIKFHKRIYKQNLLGTKICLWQIKIDVLIQACLSVKKTIFQISNFGKESSS